MYKTIRFKRIFEEISINRIILLLWVEWQVVDLWASLLQSIAGSSTMIHTWYFTDHLRFEIYSKIEMFTKNIKMTLNQVCVRKWLYYLVAYRVDSIVPMELGRWKSRVGCNRPFSIRPRPPRRFDTLLAICRLVYNAPPWEQKKKKKEKK